MVPGRTPQQINARSEKPTDRRPRDIALDKGDAGLDPAPKRYGRISITVTLATAISILVLVSVGGVFGVGVWLAQKNTLSLLSSNANQTIQATVQQLRLYLQPAEHQASFIAERITKNEVDPQNRSEFGKLLLGALAAAPQIEALNYIDSDLQSFLARQDPDQEIGLLAQDYSDDVQIREAWAALSPDPEWAPPIWREEPKKTYLNLTYPISRDSEFLGLLVAVVSVRELSSYVRTVEASDAGTRFVLYGREHVLAHPMMSDGYPGRSVENPLPSLSEFRDRILAAVWQQENSYELSFDLAEDTSGHAVEIDGEEYVFVLRLLRGFGPEPLIVGAYFHTADVGGEIRRMQISLFVGIGALILALVAAAVLGRRIARPIVDFSAAASRVRDLDVAEIRDLPGSIFRELNDQSKSFNAMLRALRWFELYVPKKIVERLVRRGEIEETISTEREITVMFTDIAGFSSLSEGMSAPAVAAFVNRHFEIVAGCIEAEDGTVDKFIGDSVMAFWGAPDPQSDAADRACRAALAIADAIRTENIRRRADGDPAIGIRIGIHTGVATIGNIGAPGRINYTIIGDAVNVGQRLEQLGKDLYPAGSEVAILISDATVRALGSGFNPIAAGKHTLKGRVGEVEAFRLA